MMKSIITVTLFLLSFCVRAEGVHTWHDIVSKEGRWSGRLVISSGFQNAYFTDSQAKKTGQLYDFHLEEGTPFIFGFGFDFDGTDFDVSYTLTLYEVGFVSKACVFNVSAKGPAQPDVRIERFNGAECEYQVVHGRGENFEVR